MVSFSGRMGGLKSAPKGNRGLGTFMTTGFVLSMASGYLVQVWRECKAGKFEMAKNIILDM